MNDEKETGVWIDALMHLPELGEKVLIYSEFNSYEFGERIHWNGKYRKGDFDTGDDYMNAKFWLRIPRVPNG